MSFWGFRIRSGGLVGTNVSGFWRVSTTNQDPEIPNLPLEDAAPSGSFISAWARNTNFTVGNMKKNVAGQKVGAQLVSATDGSVFTGAVTVYVTGDAGTQAIGSVGAGACTHEGNGYHTYAPAQAETNYDLTAFTFIGTGAVAATVQVYNSFPQTVDLSTGIMGGTITNVTTVNGLAAGVITATSIAADAITDAKVAADVTIASVTGSVGSVTGAVGSVTGNVGGNVTGSVGSVVGSIGSISNIATAVWEEIAPVTPVDDSYGLLLVLAAERALNAYNSAQSANTGVAGLPTAAQNADAVWDEVLSGHLTAGSTGEALSAANAPTALENADALLNRDMSAVSDTNARTPLNALRALRNKVSLSGTAFTVTKEDDTTSAWTAVATAAPGADPISAIDPA